MKSRWISLLAFASASFMSSFGKRLILALFLVAGIAPFPSIASAAEGDWRTGIGYSFKNNLPVLDSPLAERPDRSDLSDKISNFPSECFQPPGITEVHGHEVETLEELNRVLFGVSSLYSHPLEIVCGKSATKSDALLEIQDTDGSWRIFDDPATSFLEAIMGRQFEIYANVVDSAHTDWDKDTGVASISTNKVKTDGKPTLRYKFGMRGNRFVSSYRFKDPKPQKYFSELLDEAQMEYRELERKEDGTRTTVVFLARVDRVSFLSSLSNADDVANRLSNVMFEVTAAAIEEGFIRKYEGRSIAQKKGRYWLQDIWNEHMH